MGPRYSPSTVDRPAGQILPEALTETRGLGISSTLVLPTFREGIRYALRAARPRLACRRRDELFSCRFGPGCGPDGENADSRLLSHDAGRFRSHGAVRRLAPIGGGHAAYEYIAGESEARARPVVFEGAGRHFGQRLPDQHGGQARSR